MLTTGTPTESAAASCTSTTVRHSWRGGWGGASTKRLARVRQCALSQVDTHTHTLAHACPALAPTTPQTVPAQLDRVYVPEVELVGSISASIAALAPLLAERPPAALGSRRELAQVGVAYPLPAALFCT